MLTFLPEPLESLRSRYTAALSHVFDTESIGLGIARRPGETRANVFDCEDGLRLIISLDDVGREVPNYRGVVLHLSASLMPNTSLHEKLSYLARKQGANAATEMLCRVAVTWFQTISGNEQPLELLGFTTEKGVPHWYQATEVKTHVHP